MDHTLSVILSFFVIITLVFFDILFIIKLKVDLPLCLNNKSKIDKLNFYFAILAAIVLVIIAVYFIFTFQIWAKISNLEDSGRFGDTFNGITAPFIALIAGILVFVTFQEQVRANKIQRNLNEYKNYLDTIIIYNQQDQDIQTICTNAVTDIAAGNINSQNVKLLYLTVQDFRQTAKMIYHSESGKESLFAKLRLVWEMKYFANIEAVNTAIVQSNTNVLFTSLIGEHMLFNIAFVRLKNSLEEPEIYLL